MGFFFNGRLWKSPATMSAVDSSAMRNLNLTVGNTLAIIGRSTGGKPNTALRFGSPSEARAMLLGGELCEAVEKAFDPSAQTNAPATVIAVRVNPATQAALNLSAAAAGGTVISLASEQYGLVGNRVKVKVASGTNVGKKLTTQVGNDYTTADDVHRNAFSVVYSGAQASSRMSVTGTTLTLEAPNSTAVATIDLASYPTVIELVDRINAVSGFAAAVLDGNDAAATLNALDYVSHQDVKTATYTATANLQAIVDWFNGVGEGYVTATRAAGVGVVPDNLADWNYLDGGSDGTTTPTEWANALTALQYEDVQWVVPLTSDASIHAQVDAHVAYMSAVARQERRAVVGMAAGSSDAAAITAAKALNSDRTSLVHLGYYDYNMAGAWTLFPPYMLASMVAAAFAGSNPGTPLTNKSLKVRGLERKLRNPTDTDALIDGGVLAVEDTVSGFKVVQSISTWLVSDDYNRVEVSVGWAIDFVARNVRNAVDDLRGQKGSPITMGEAASRVESTLRELSRPEPMGPGVLVGDTDNPPYRNIQVSLDADVLRIEFECHPVIGINFIPVVIHAVPYTGSITL